MSGFSPQNLCSMRQFLLGTAMDGAKSMTDLGITLLAVDHEISNRLLEKCPETGLSSASV
jgi:hypothetical protein